MNPYTDFSKIIGYMTEASPSVKQAFESQRCKVYLAEEEINDQSITEVLIDLLVNDLEELGITINCHLTDLIPEWHTGEMIIKTLCFFLPNKLNRYIQDSNFRDTLIKSMQGALGDDIIDVILDFLIESDDKFQTFSEGAELLKYKLKYNQIFETYLSNYLSISPGYTSSSDVQSTEEQKSFLDIIADRVAEGCEIVSVLMSKDFGRVMEVTLKALSCLHDDTYHTSWLFSKQDAVDDEKNYEELWLSTYKKLRENNSCFPEYYQLRSEYVTNNKISPLNTTLALLCAYCLSDTDGVFNKEYHYIKTFGDVNDTVFEKLCLSITNRTTTLPDHINKLTKLYQDRRGSE